MSLSLNCVYKKIITKSILFIDATRTKVIATRTKIVSIEMAFLYYNGLTDICTTAAAVVPNQSQMA